MPTQLNDVIPRRFAGRVVLVSGAASGIGAAAADRFAAEGADVVLLDVADERGRAVAGSLGGRGTYLHCDVAAAGDWAAAGAFVRDRFGRADVVFGNGPGRVAPAVPLHALTEADWDRQVAVTLKAAFLAARVFCPMLAETAGSLVLTSSVHANVGLPGCAPYAAAKAGLLGLTRQLAVEYAPRVRVNAVVPGPVETPAWDGVDAAGRAATLRETPAGRLGDPAEIAAAVDLHGRASGRSSRRPNAGTAGATRCGGIRTAPSPSGEGYPTAEPLPYSYRNYRIQP